MAAQEYEYYFDAQDFSAGGLSQEPQASRLRGMTKAGWELVDTNLAHPYLFSLWRRAVGELLAPAGDKRLLEQRDAALQAHDDLAEQLRKVMAERDELKRALAELQPRPPAKPAKAGT